MKEIYTGVADGSISIWATGTNEEGETIIINGIDPDNGELSIDTIQNNGWVRTNYYNKYGSCVGETYSK